MLKLFQNIFLCRPLAGSRISQHMKKIDILNFITDFRKSPNDVKTYAQLVSHLGIQHEPSIQAMLNDLKQLGVVKEMEHEGEKAYQVAKK